MSFSTLEWINNSFSQSYLKKHINTLDDVRDIVAQIWQDEDLVRFGGTEAPLNWVRRVEWILGGAGALNFQGWDGLDDVYGGDRSGSRILVEDEILNWLSGSAQSHKKSRYRSKFNENVRELKDDIANVQSNIANILDFSNPAITDAEKAVYEQRVAEYLAENQRYFDWAEQLGIEIANIIYREGEGWVPASWGTGSSSGATSQSTPGHTGDYLSIIDNGNGTYDIVGQAGTVYEAGISNISDALARQTELQSGAYPDATGAFAPTTTTGDTTSGTGTSATGLPESIDTSAFTTEQLAFLQELGGLASSDMDLMNQLLGEYAITDEDIAGFLEKAREEVEPYYSQIFERGVEDYQNALTVRTLARTRELQYEQMQREAEIRSAQGSLEASGMTSTGEAVRQLGTQSAYDQGLLGEEVPEGLLPQQQGLIASSSLAQFEEDVRSVGRGYEDVYGGATLSGVELPTLSGETVFTPDADVRGSAEREQETYVQTRADELAAQEAVRRAAVFPDADATELANYY